MKREELSKLVFQLIAIEAIAQKRSLKEVLSKIS